MASLLQQHRLSVYAEHDLFTLYDPTCDEPADLRPAAVGAIAGGIGWADSAVSVRTTPNVRWVTAQVLLWDGDPNLPGQGSLAMPSGQWCVDLAVDAPFRLGIALPTGPGTYAVRLSVQQREEVRRRRDAAFAADPLDTAALDALRGLETYRFELWQTSTEPAWDTEDDDSAREPEYSLRRDADGG